MNNKQYLIGLEAEELDYYLTASNDFSPFYGTAKLFENKEDAAKYKDFIESSFKRSYTRVVQAAETGGLTPSGIKIPMHLLVRVNEVGLVLFELTVSTKKVK